MSSKCAFGEVHTLFTFFNVCLPESSLCASSAHNKGALRWKSDASVMDSWRNRTGLVKNGDLLRRCGQSYRFLTGLQVHQRKIRFRAPFPFHNDHRTLDRQYRASPPADVCFLNRSEQLPVKASDGRIKFFARTLRNLYS